MPSVFYLFQYSIFGLAPTPFKLETEFKTKLFVLKNFLFVGYRIYRFSIIIFIIKLLLSKIQFFSKSSSVKILVNFLGIILSLLNWLYSV
jgi:hypothetical protein